LAEFAYNSFINMYTRLSRFEVVTSFKSGKLIDLLPIPISDRPSVSVEFYAQCVHDLHTEL